MRHLHKFTGSAAFLIAILLFPGVWAEAGPKTFAFVDTHYVITAEVASEHSFILNFINLSDFVIVVQPNEFIYRGASGRFYIGQVYDHQHKDRRGELQRYTASVLLKGHSFTGLTVVGAFHEQDQIEEMSVRIGAKRFYMQALDKPLFDELANKIGDLDLSNSDAAAALQQANIKPMGSVKSTDGTSEWDRDWQGLLTPDGVNVPKVIERPEISPTDEAKKSRMYGKIKLSGLVNKSGGLQDLKVVKGLGHGLDEKVLNVVKSSWVFLPATKNGEVLDAVIGFEVDLPPPPKTK